MQNKKEIEYVGQIRNDSERENFFEDVLSTMVFDTCGITHATGIVIDDHCAGCGECVALDTHSLIPRRWGQ
ncbi:MAG: hypothetical protein KAV87_34835 [Desulfobacteraceae bacterium]|nr:hypothetical protein [Desulfobacteraceae bacterium]